MTNKVLEFINSDKFNELGLYITGAIITVVAVIGMSIPYLVAFGIM